MSQYSEMVGSFIRTGNYPLEAHYIFPTEEILKEFYSDELNATTIHKGLLRIVENDGTGKQGLYWVTKKQTNNDLEFTKLISGTDIKNIFDLLQDLETRLTEEIKSRTDADIAIWGTNDPTVISEDLNSLLDLANAVITIKKEISDMYEELTNTDNILKTEIKALAGTEEDDVVEYLKTLPYKSLTETSIALNKFLNEVDNTSHKINTLPELQFFLEGYHDKLKLRHILLDLLAEILGNPIPSLDFITLRAIEDFVRILKADSENTDRNLLTEINLTQIGVGLNSDGSYSSDQETYYLKDATSIMNALKILDSLTFKAISGITLKPENDDVVDLAVRKELDGYTISAKLNLSNQLGNDLIKKEDGLYFNVSSTYVNGILSLYSNDKLISQHVLGLSAIVESALYDPTLEAIVLVLKLISGDKQTIVIPVGALIREWDIDNSQPSKVVELARNVVIDGQDTLSADVRIWIDKNNILKKYGNTLGVEGTSENITHNSLTLKIFLDGLRDSITDNNTAIDNKIDSEIARAIAKESFLEELISLVDSKIEGFTEYTDNAVAVETNRAISAENSLSDSISEVNQKVENNATRIDTLETNLETTKEEIEQKIITIGEGTDEKIAGKAELSAVLNLNTSITDLTSKIDAEIERATSREDEIEDLLTSSTQNLDSKINNNTNNIESLESSISEIEETKAPKDSPTFTGSPKIATSPNSDDNSSNIPTTSWVNSRINEGILNIGIDGYYDKDAVANLLSGKADLENGKVPYEQLPKLYIIEVE